MHLKPKRRSPPAPMIEALKTHFSDRFTTSTTICEQHGVDEGAYPVTAPDGVVFCESNNDVEHIVQLAFEYGVPVIPFAIGSSLEGHVLAIEGGISVDVSRMNRVLKINAEDLTATVEPGVTREQLNHELRTLGLFFPVDPGANASIGGMSATRASGTNAVRYGTMRENVLGLQMVTATRGTIKTGTRAQKSSAGYDLTKLFVGSEGTLGIITEITVKLYPLPEAVSAAVCQFQRVEDAINTTIQTMQLGVPIARCEFLDSNAVKEVNAYSKLGLTEGPMLLMEFHGSPSSVKEQVQTVQTIAQENGGFEFQWATTPEERTRLWKARHSAYSAGKSMHPGCLGTSTDVCVPISKLAEMITLATQEAQASNLPHTILGHVGDGNFHVLYYLREGDNKQLAIAEQLATNLAKKAIELDGTCTGEHGIGMHKIALLELEAGEGAIQTMISIKKALDPKNIFNPSKIFLTN